MDVTAPHAGFVIAAYAVSGLVLAGAMVITHLVLRWRERALSELERQDVPLRQGRLKP